MSFIPDRDTWVRSHFIDVPRETVEFCGDISGTVTLNLGCGDMLADFGLLGQQVKRIIGLDISYRSSNFVQLAAQALRAKGFEIPESHSSRLSYCRYDGEGFPFKDGSFDFIFSWSAFEHVGSVGRVLSEAYRVLRSGGRAFVQVFPWYHCYYGSHLSDYIGEPYFHLRRTPRWVEQALRHHIRAHPEEHEFLLEHQFPEYLTLNGYSANRFYADVIRSGFHVTKARLISYDQDLSHAPAGVEFSDLMICGTKMLLVKQ